MFLANIGTNKEDAVDGTAATTSASAAAGANEELTKKLLEKAGIKSDLSDKKEIIA